jgi:hypothetical protein
VPPDAVSVIAEPEQNDVPDDIAIVGNVFTVRILEAVAVHPLISVPVTEYIPPTETTVELVVAEFDQLYVLAPVTVNVAVLP